MNTNYEDNLHRLKAIGELLRGLESMDSARTSIRKIIELLDDLELHEEDKCQP